MIFNLVDWATRLHVCTDALQRCPHDRLALREYAHLGTKGVRFLHIMGEPGKLMLESVTEHTEPY